MKSNQTEKSSYYLFLNNICKDVLLFIFFILVFLLYKIIFLFNFRAELADVSYWEIVKTLLFSVKFSLKTVGFLLFVSFVFSTAIQQFFPKYPADKIRYIISGIFLFIISMLFQVRIPYYTEFHVSFSPFIFNTFNDDVSAIFKTIIIQYGLFWRIALALFLTFSLMISLKYWLKLSARLFNFINKFNSKTLAIVFLPLLILSILYIRFDGDWTLSSYSDITRKDTITINHHLLKETLFDEIDALSNAYEMWSISKNISYNVTLEEVKEALSLLSKGYNEKSLLPFLTHSSKGPIINQPKHIFLIVGENYPLWPLLPQYNNLPLAKNMRHILQKYDNILVKKFVSASGGTMASFSSIVTGLPYMGLNEKLFLNDSYETGLFPQMNKLGYKTQFFYGGEPSWASLDFFINNQGVDNSYYYSSFSGEKAIWGIEDRSLFKGIISKIDDSPSFNLILTTSNHSPYTTDMSKEPDITSKEEMEKFIDKEVTDKDLLITRMQNFEYMDKCICDFIESILEKYPDSMFVITGDHAQRWNIDNNPSLYERLMVPLIIIGKGINKAKITADAVGGHIDIIPTIIELIAPKGTPYFSLGKDVLNEQNLGISDAFWINSKVINYGLHNNKELFEPNRQISQKEIDEDSEKIKAYKTITAWRILYGLELEEKKS